MYSGTDYALTVMTAHPARYGVDVMNNEIKVMGGLMVLGLAAALLFLGVMLADLI